METPTSGATSGRERARMVAEHWRGRAATAARDPRSWIVTALELREAARVVQRRADEDDDGAIHMAIHPVIGLPRPGALTSTSLWRVYFLLAGLALENLAKAHIVEREPDLVDEDGLGPGWPGRGHDLRELFRRAQIRLSWEELRLVLGLERFVSWGGRYPVAKLFREASGRARTRERSRSVSPRVRSGVLLVWPDGFSPEREPAVFESLFARVAELDRRGIAEGLARWVPISSDRSGPL